MRIFDKESFIEFEKEHGISDEELEKDLETWVECCNGKEVIPSKYGGLLLVVGTPYGVCKEWTKEVEQ